MNIKELKSALRQEQENRDECRSLLRSFLKEEGFRYGGFGEDGMDFYTIDIDIHTFSFTITVKLDVNEAIICRNGSLLERVYYKRGLSRVKKVYGETLSDLCEVTIRNN